MNIEAIKKALEGVNAAFLRVLAEAPADATHYSIGLDLEDTAIRITLEDMRAISAAIPEIDRLQRENAALREDRYKLACAITGGEDAPGLLDNTPTSEIVEIAQHARRMHQDDIDRAMAAEAEVKRLHGTPDYCYDPENWEYTCHWADRDEVHGFGESLKFGEPMKVNTLINGPTKWVADVPLTRDEEGFPDDTEIQWFDSEEAARTALASTGGDHHGN